MLIVPVGMVPITWARAWLDPAFYAGMTPGFLAIARHVAGDFLRRQRLADPRRVTGFRISPATGGASWVFPSGVPRPSALLIYLLPLFRRSVKSPSRLDLQAISYANQTADHMPLEAPTSTTVPMSSP